MILSDEIKDLLKDDKGTYKEVNASQIKIETPKKESINFVNNNTEFWAKMGRVYLSYFEKGELISNYRGVSEHDYLTFLLGVSRVLEEIIKEEIVKRECDTTEIKEVFNLINSSFKVLSFSIEKSLASEFNNQKDKPIDINLLFSAFHGFISSFIDKHTNT